MNTKKIVISLLSLVLMIGIAIPSIAVEDYKISIRQDKQFIHPGDTVKLTLSISDINVTNGLGSFLGKITYDTAIFEAITQEDIVKLEGWAAPIYNPDGGYVVIETESGNNTIEASDILEITLKVKADAQAINTAFTISDITCSDSQNDFISDDITLNMQITPTDPTGGSGSGSTGGNSLGNNTSNNTNNNDVINNLISGGYTNGNNTTNNATRNNTVNTNRNTNNTTGSSGSSIPHAGLEDYTMPAIIVLLAIAAISYVAYRRIKNV